MRKLVPYLSILAALGCEEGESTDRDAAVMADADGATRTLSLGFDDLPTLGSSHVYEGWLIVDGNPVTSGRFSVESDGTLNPATFEIQASDANDATLFVLTIEPATGDVPEPSDTHVVAGAFSDGSATLSIDHAAALGTDFEDAAGSFVLNTPTTTTNDDAGQGIWFLTPGDPLQASLTLPELPNGWAYEGWVVDTSGSSPMPISTGRFRDPAAMDSDGAGGSIAGPEEFPPFPGQDYINPARDLTSDHVAVISVEPEPDDSPSPFQLKPLATMIADGVGAENIQTLENGIAANTISGTATFDN